MTKLTIRPVWPRDRVPCWPAFEKDLPPAPDGQVFDWIVPIPYRPERAPNSNGKSRSTPPPRRPFGPF